MADELAPRRRTRASTPAVAPRAPRKATTGRSKPPTLWLWFVNQAAHTDPVKSSAVRYVMGRFPINEYANFARINRVLMAEESDHHYGFFQVLTEYREAFELDEEKFASITNTGKDLLPTTAEICIKCRREAVPGTQLCRKHGGVWITYEDQQVLSANVTQKLISMQDRAVVVLQDLMDSAKSEDVRLRAAQDVLSRIRGNAPVVIEHTGSVEIVGADAAKQVMERLERLAPRAQEIVEGYGDVVDGEVVEA